MSHYDREREEYYSSRVTEDTVDLLRSRAKVGKDKYGVTMDRQDLTPEQWCQHAIEELLDGAQYLMKLKGILNEARNKNN